ncbi:reverse transcriptase-like protein [Elysia marginata]|uniref:Reverse transcriptase-like protein n=1 Tax=Elysia marginata TaxID=1093978 RepID=A0AAV4IHI9_9GAST|nr:reverse transcriptase-like protein [Elysia marginata]
MCQTKSYRVCNKFRTKLGESSLLCTKNREHVTPVFKSVHWLHITARVEFKIPYHTYKCLKGEAPVYLSELMFFLQPHSSPEVDIEEESCTADPEDIKKRELSYR